MRTLIESLEFVLTVDREDRVLNSASVVVENDRIAQFGHDRISTFGIGETTYNLPLIAVLAGLALFVVSIVRSKAQARAARLRAIHLVKLPKKKPDEPTTPGSSPTPPSAAPPTSAAAPTAGQRSSTRQS